jgi:predicted MPP superfamily phosphohydrolase
MKYETGKKRRLLGYLFALALTVTMLLGLCITAAAEETSLGEGKTVLAFTSDIHNTSGKTESNRLDKWLTNETKAYGHIDGMAFCGDMGSASASESEFWTYTSNVMSVVSDHEIPGAYTTGNHEFINGKFKSTTNAVKEKYTVGDVGASGDNYLIYCLGTEDGNSDNITSDQINALKGYLSKVGKDKPIIVLTHYPLHACSGSGWFNRSTQNADLVIDALNNAVPDGKTIILL